MIPLAPGAAVGTPPARAEDALAFAQAHFEALAAGDSPGPSPALLRDAASNAATAQRLLAILQDPAPLGLDRGAALAAEATRWQAAVAGVRLSAEEAPSTHDLPSGALLALAAREGVELAPAEVDAVRAYDLLAPPTRDALTRVVDAFLGFDARTRAAYEGASPDQLRGAAMRALAPEAPAEPDPLRAAGVDLGPVLAARQRLVEAAAGLAAALAVHPLSSETALATAFCPAFSIDLSGSPTPNTYATDCALIVDAAGDDAYLNNAGGGHVRDSILCPLVGAFPAAAVIDLGGSDTYDPPQKDCGVVGGGYLGAGFLLDAGGADTYLADGLGTKGGAFGGAGFLMDLGLETDVYSSPGDGVNRCLLGTCGVVCVNGCGVNGGGVGGIGFLLDEGGDETMAAGDSGVNGGGATGVGFLLDRGGIDTRTGTRLGVNGGGVNGHGFLLDGGGNDLYQTPFIASDFCNVSSCGINGGGYQGGVGFLLDVGGNDRYETGATATNGGGRDGVGTLIDLAGDDRYTAGSLGTNGGAAEAAAGLLLDLSGRDAYSAVAEGVNGAGLAGVGLLLDGGGSGDAYADAQAFCPGSGTDRTVAPKCQGAQVDVPR